MNLVKTNKVVVLRNLIFCYFFVILVVVNWILFEKM